MKLVEMKCKNCGAKLEVEENTNDINCQYCHAHYKLDDEVKHVQYDNMEQSGYDFEKGRLRAQQEHSLSNNKTNMTYGNNDVKKKHGLIYYLLFICFFPFVITYYVIKSEKLSKKAKIGILAALWSLIIIAGIASEKEEQELDKNHWATDCTQISDFDYYLDGEEIIVKKYNGSDKRIKICSTYNVDGKDYSITKFSEGVFALENVYSVILPDTLKSMPNNTFNSSNIKYVYIPKSLEPQTGYAFYSYFHDVETIYYAGSKEEWKILTNNIDREKIDAKNIVYDAQIEDLK